MKYNRIKAFFQPFTFSALVLFTAPAIAQEQFPFQAPHQTFLLANELHAYGIFSIADAQAQRFLQHTQRPFRNNSLMEKERAKYLSSKANLRLERPGALSSTLKLAQSSGNAAMRQRLAYALGKHYFFHGQLDEAIHWYEQAGLDNLTNEEIAESKFELAYAYLLQKNFSKAEELFGTMRNTDTRYSADAKYYYGLLSYNHGHYDLALQSFESIQQEPRYATVVPYYIAELHYFTGKKQQALSEAKAIIAQEPAAYFQTEAHLLAGQILYEQKNFEEALTYLEYYFDRAEKMQKEQLYEMGYAYYQLHNYPSAIDKFKLLSNTGDTLGQSAMYMLGNAYLKTGDKQSARNAFGIAAGMNFNEEVREASLFTAAKLAYELGYYTEAGSFLKDLKDSYPLSSFKDEARSIQSDILARTNNYVEAYAMLQEEPANDAFYRTVHQRVAYGLGITELLNKNVVRAQSLLQEALTINADPEYSALANHWLGELAYEQQRYNEAIAYHQSFLKQPITQRLTDNPQTLQHNALLTMGYASMQLEDFAAAQQYFSRAQKVDGASSPSSDALVREADAAFMRKDFNRALMLYDSVGKSSHVDADYAQLQTAIIQGLKGNKKVQVALLQQIIQKSPPSPQLNDARYELANVYIVDNDYTKAVQLLQPLIEERSTFASRALFKKAFALQQLNKDEEAIQSYKQILSDYPYSEERDQSIDALKALYVEQNKPGELAQVLQQNNLQQNQESVLDSVYYNAAVNQYAQSNYDKAFNAFKDYLQKYPNGNFRLKANYYAGNAAYQLRKFDEAMPYLEEVLQAGTNEFTEQAAQQAGSIAFAQKNYALSNRYFEQLRSITPKPQLQLEANLGLMRAAVQQQQWEQGLAYATEILQATSATEAQKLEAQFVRGKSAYQKQDWAKAADFFMLSKQSKDRDIAAESTYRIGEVLYHQQKWKEAEEQAGSSLKALNGHDYWLVKNYILLADILTQQKDWFNARATLQSVIKNSKDDALKKVAEQKLEQVNQLEKEQSKLAE